ncbi:MAG: hypothetical protein JXR79_08970 [Nitrospirae bacterium]|nr:hypothetical protein [Nitrospirota bacterium]
MAEEDAIKNRLAYILILLCFLAVIPLYLNKSKVSIQSDVQIPDAASQQDQVQQAEAEPEFSDSEKKDIEITPSISKVLIDKRAAAPSSMSPAPDNSLELMQRGWNELNKGRYENSLKLFLEASSKNRSALIGAGISSFMIRDYEKAVTYLEPATDIDDGFLRNKFLSFAYYRTDDIKKSIASAQKALSIKNDPELKRFLARLHKETNTHNRYLDESASRFKVMFDGYEHGQISRVVLGHLDDAYRKISNDTGYFPEGVVEVILYTGQDFFDITQAPQWAGGLFDGRIKIPVRGAEYNDALLRTVLTHEYVHAVVWSITRNCPLWINEGLAEYFSRKYPKKVGQIIPLKNLEKSFAWLQGQHVLLAYVQSYSAVSDMADKYGMVRIMDMLRSFEKSGDIEQAFKDSFAITYSEFINSWGRK